MRALILWYRKKNLTPAQIDKYGAQITAWVKTIIYVIAIGGWLFIPLWACFFIMAFGLCLDWKNDGRWFPWSPPATVPCPKCNGGRFNGRGSGYGDVCDWCAGSGEDLY